MKIAFVEVPEAWDAARAGAAVKALGGFETRLLWRIADAHGARVPLSELARDLGMPGDASLERDFPDLHSYCEAQEPALPLPVIAGGGEGPWYWMGAADAAQFRRALEQKVFPKSVG